MSNCLTMRTIHIKLRNITFWYEVSAVITNSIFHYLIPFLTQLFQLTMALPQYLLSKLVILPQQQFIQHTLYKPLIASVPKVAPSPQCGQGSIKELIQSQPLLLIYITFPHLIHLLTIWYCLKNQLYLLLITNSCSQGFINSS